jgi:FkbM family methyltransferase
MKTTLSDGTPIHCIKKPEARMLDHHVEGYLQHGIQIEDSNVVFDVGANVGVFGVRAMQKAENVRVFCFEPIPEIAEALRANATLHGDGRMTVFQEGVSSNVGEASFTYFPNAPALSTAHPEQWDNNPGAFKEAVKSTMKNPPESMRWMRWIPTVFSGLIAGYLVKGRHEVTCKLTTISEVIKTHALDRIDLMKIDCEGAEWDTLMGIGDENWSKIKSFVIEVHDENGRLEQVRNLLLDRGFTRQVVEQEEGLENSKMYNLFALR